MIEFIDLTAFKSFTSKYSLDLKNAIAKQAQQQQQLQQLTGGGDGEEGKGGVGRAGGEVAKTLKEAESRCRAEFSQFEFAQIRCMKEESKRLGTAAKQQQ